MVPVALFLSIDTRLEWDGIHPIVIGVHVKT